QVSWLVPRYCFPTIPYSNNPIAIGKVSYGQTQRGCLAFGFNGSQWVINASKGIPSQSIRDHFPCLFRIVEIFLQHPAPHGSSFSDLVHSGFVVCHTLREIGCL